MKNRILSSRFSGLFALSFLMVGCGGGQVGVTEDPNLNDLPPQQYVPPPDQIFPPNPIVPPLKYAESTIPNLVFSPDGTMEYEIKVLDAGKAIEKAHVDLVISKDVGAKIAWCEGHKPNQILADGSMVLSSISDVQGVARFKIAAAGCVDPNLLTRGQQAINVFINDVRMKEIGAVSPDIVDNNSLLPTDRFYQSSQTRTGVSYSDVQYFAPLLTNGQYNFCADFDQDGKVTTADSNILSSKMSIGVSCKLAK